MAGLNFPELVFDLAAFGLNLGVLPNSKADSVVRYHTQVDIIEKIEEHFLIFARLAGVKAESNRPPPSLLSKVTDSRRKLFD